MHPLLVDVDPLRWEMSADILREALATHRIDAVMPVRAFGFVRDHADLVEVAARAGIPVVFDSAAALGHGRVRAGDAPAAACEVFSLHATKSFAIGEGGAIVGSPALAARVRQVLNFGLNEDRSFGDGMNGKMAEVQAAIGNAALDILDPLLERRRQVADAYTAMMRRYNSLTLPVETEDCPWSLFPVRLPEGSDVPALLGRAAAHGLQLRRYYFPSLAGAYKGRGGPIPAAGNLGTAASLAAHMVCFPVYADMTDGELATLGRIVDDLFG